MSIKVNTYSQEELTLTIKSDIVDGKEYNRKEFRKLIEESKYIDTSIVNGLRRYIIGKINTLAFDYYQKPTIPSYVNFEKNDSNMNNDFIGHRLGLLPINIRIVKYILLIYKIILGHTNELDKYLKNSDDSQINIFLKKNLKIKDNLDLIHKLEFHIDETNKDEDIIEITTDIIKLKLYNIDEKIELDYKDYKDKVKKYEKIFNVYEKFNKLDKNSWMDINKLVKNVFPSYTYNDKTYYALLCKLKKKESLKCNVILNEGNGERHARFSTVAPCTYSFVIDNEMINKIINMKLVDSNLENLEFQKKLGLKDKDDIMKFINDRYSDQNNFKLNDKQIKIRTEFINKNKDNNNIDKIEKFISEKDILLNNFNKCDYQRYFKGKEEKDLYKREFDFTIESNHFYLPERIFYKGYKKLKKDLLDYCDNVLDLFNNFANYPLQNEEFKITSSAKIINGVDILYYNGNHSIGNIIHTYLYYCYDKEVVQYIGYQMIHPLKTELLLTIGFDKDKFENIVKDMFTKLKEIFNNMNLVIELSS